MHIHIYTIYTDMHRYAQIYTDMHRYAQICTDIHRYTQIKNKQTHAHTDVTLGLNA